MSPRYASPAKPKTESELAREIVIRIVLPNGEPYEFNLHDVEWINLDDPLGEIQSQAQRYAFYAFLHVEAKDALRAAQGSLREYFVKEGELVREALTTTNSVGTRVSPTETRVKQGIEMQVGHRRLQADVEKWERTVERIGVVRESLIHRRDMLTAMSLYRAPEAGATVEGRASYRIKNR